MNQSKTDRGPKTVSRKIMDVIDSTWFILVVTVILVIVVLLSGILTS
jgi:hypothetical protein